MNHLVVFGKSALVRVQLLCFCLNADLIRTALATSMRCSLKAVCALMLKQQYVC
jgi:hypothetical protein